MRKYLLAYSVWLSAVLAMAGLALWWYRKVEAIGWREVAQRLNDVIPEPHPTEDTEIESD